MVKKNPKKKKFNRKKNKIFVDYLFIIYFYYYLKMNLLEITQSSSSHL